MPVKLHVVSFTLPEASIHSDYSLSSRAARTYRLQHSLLPSSSE